MDKPRPLTSSGRPVDEASRSFERRVIVVALMVLAGGSWVLLWQQASADDMAEMHAGTGLAAAAFLAMWVVMMVATMFPAALPMIVVFHQIQSARRQRGQAFVATWIFVAAYLFVWAAIGVVAYLLALGTQALAPVVGLTDAMLARLGGALILAAGIYQLTPLKDMCLSKCRTPVGFIMTSWREGSAGAFRMGIAHGLYCLGCCWLLFVVLFPLGMMNILAIALITIFIIAEKTLPSGFPAVRIGAAALIVYGASVMVVPTLLPGPAVNGHDMLMPDGTLMKMP